jgi:hypothetical protein
VIPIFPEKVRKFCPRADKKEKQEGNTLRGVSTFVILQVPKNQIIK